jgi:hypothetical protein
MAIYIIHIIKYLSDKLCVYYKGNNSSLHNIFKTLVFATTLLILTWSIWQAYLISKNWDSLSVSNDPQDTCKILLLYIILMVSGFVVSFLSILDIWLNNQEE